MSLKQSTDDVQCYIGNTQELLQDLEGEVFNDTGEVIEVDIQQGGKLLQILWDQFKETVLECEGKRVVVKYPAGWQGQLLRFAATFVGFNLESPTVVDSPDLVPDHIKQQIINDANNA